MGRLSKLKRLWMEEFESHMGEDLINQLSTNEYSDLFSDWMNTKRDGSDEEDGYDFLNM
jgi:hypothetical protein